MSTVHEMGRNEFEKLARRIYTGEGTDEELGKMRYSLCQYARSDDIYSYMYYPKPDQPQKPTIEQIVEKTIELRNGGGNVIHL